MATKAQKMIETQQVVSEEVTREVSMTQLRETVEGLFATNTQLQESLSNVSAMFAKEDMGWFKLGYGDEEQGLSLDDLKNWSLQIREAIVGNPHIKRGARNRAANIWEGGIHYSGLKGAVQGGKTANVKELIAHPLNQKYFFGNVAREEREIVLYTDSIALNLGDDRTKTLSPVPLEQITGDYRNPDDSAEIWAYRRAWSRFVPGEAAAVPMVRWYFTDTFKDRAVDKIKVAGGVEEIVDRTKTMFDASVNTQIGWAYGAPDALSALIWARLYRDFLVNGKIMSDAMATFAFKATSTTRAGADNASMKVASAQTGSTAILGATNDLVPMSNAGKGYDFSSGDALLAVVATALETSIIVLSSNPGTAGASYGSAANLDLPTKLAIRSRRQWHIDYDSRVLHWMGAKDFEVTFDSMEDATDIFRQVQAVLLFWSSGLMHPEEARSELVRLLAIITNKAKAPVGVMTPNNLEFKDSLTNDGTNAAATPSATPANGQGKSSPVGKGVNANDVRSDGVTEMMARLEAFMLAEEALRVERDK